MEYGPQQPAVRGDDSAQRRWEQRTHGPLLLLATFFAVAYAVPVVRPGISDGTRLTCTCVEWAVWAAFAVDYATRLFLAADRLRFVRSHPLALLAVILPLVQPLRLLRLVSAALLAGQRARTASQVQLTVYVTGSCAGLLVFGSLAVLEVERDAPGSSIKTLGDAVWWSFTTMTTVGYGDLAPTTTLGRVLAIGLMLSGIALLGVVTANIAAWFVARVEREDAGAERHTAAVTALTAEVRALRAEVAELRGTRQGEPGTARPPGIAALTVAEGAPPAPAGAAGTTDGAGPAAAPGGERRPAPPGEPRARRAEHRRGTWSRLRRCTRSRRAGHGRRAGDRPGRHRGRHGRRRRCGRRHGRRSGGQGNRHPCQRSQILKART